MPETALALEVTDVSKRYGRRWALARLSFTLERGRALLLTGSNGSGKTTLLRLIATAMRPTAGRMRVLGWDCREDRQEIRQHVALLSHASYLYEDLSAEQNLLLLAKLLQLSSPRQQVSTLLEQVGLPKRPDPIRHFSAGMRKRLSIARLLMKSPNLALLDEPFEALDPHGIATMERLIRELRSAGATVVLATHQVQQGAALCDRRLHLAEGRAVAT
jgi:heme exporter protein A